MDKQHIFEAEGLGKAPYRLLGVLFAGEPTEMNPKPGTSCDYCSTYITNIFKCESADGKRFLIGSTCVDKLGDAGLKKLVDQKVREHRRELRRIKELKAWEAAAPERERLAAEKEAQEAERKTHVQAEYDRVKPLLATQPHPNGFFASKGKTLVDYVEYCGLMSHPGLQAIREAGGEV
jgi:hypothetical protein